MEKLRISGKNATEQAKLLYPQLLEIYEQIKSEGKVEVFGDLDFEIVEKIDNKRHRIAKLKGNKILVKQDAIALPKSALKYILAHEIAHIFTKRHSKKFWKIVQTIYPDFEVGEKLLMKYAEMLSAPSPSPKITIDDEAEKDEISGARGVETASEKPQL